MPRPPRNLHLVATWLQPWQCDSQKTRNTTRLKCCACHAKWRWTRPKWRACHENCISSYCKRRRSIAPATQNDFRYVTKRVWMSRSATPAMRNEATRRLKPPKTTTFCRTYHRHGHTVLTRTVANGCERLRTVASGCDHKRNVERTHPQPPDPQSETGTLATHSGRSKKQKLFFSPILNLPRTQVLQPWFLLGKI